MYQRLLAICLLFFLQSSVYAQHGDYYVVKNLENDWLVQNDDGSYKHFAEDTKSKVVYILLDNSPFQEEVLKITGSNFFSIYIDHQLIFFNRKNLLIDLDSLADVRPAPWLLGIYQEDDRAWLSTNVMSRKNAASTDGPILRVESYFLDFSILATILLSVFFVALFRMNPKLTLDYLNFIRLFSLQEREDTLLNSRISSSANILYYVFISLLSSFSLLVIFHFGGTEISVAQYFSVVSFWEGTLRWFQLTVIIACMLVIKLILISVMSNLFDSEDTLSYQFYNYVRLLFFIFEVASFVTLFYFIFTIQNPKAFSFLIYGFIFSLIFWILLISLKLLWQTSFKSFHLFSYLCASELIPTVFIIKVLNS